MTEGGMLSQPCLSQLIDGQVASQPVGMGLGCGRGGSLSFLQILLGQYRYWRR